MSLNNLIIKKPIVTERTTDLSKLNKYVFMVDIKAKSGQIRQAVEKIYNVTVIAINIVRINTNDKNIKKAIVTLKEGNKIDVIPQ